MSDHSEVEETHRRPSVIEVEGARDDVIDDVIDDGTESRASITSVPSPSSQDEHGDSRTTASSQTRLANDAADCSIAPPRDHSYLEESHPLLPDEDRYLRMASGRALHRDSTGLKPTAKRTLEVAVLELHGVVLFPGCTIPVKLQNRSMIRYLGRQIRLCRNDPVAQPVVQLGILPYEYQSPEQTLPQQHRRRRRTNEPQEEPQRASQRRGSWMRRGFSFGNREIRATESSHALRRSLTRLQDEFQFDENMDLEDSERSSGDDSDGDVGFDENNDEHSLPRPPLSPEQSHPLVGRIGTIATVRHTHERASSVGGHGGSDPSYGHSQSSSTLWGRYEEAPELVFTAVGTSRFRILSCLNDDENLFEVEDMRDEPLLLPPVPFRLLPFRGQCVHFGKVDDNDESDDGNNDDEHLGKGSIKTGRIRTSESDVVETRSTRMQAPIERMAWNLSRLTPVPYFVYLQLMPWSLVWKIAEALQTNNGRGNLPSLGDDSVVTNRENLEPTKFSYWMANNAPFSEAERKKLLKTSSVLERLLFIWKKVCRWTAENAETRICCELCETNLTGVSNIFTVGGAEGTTSTYVNGHGFIHQITTLRNVDESKLSFQGLPSTENSYFPGYSWLITSCYRCGSILGWKFQKVGNSGIDANGGYENGNGNIVDRDTPQRPPHFYGFMSSNVKIKSRSR